MCNIFTSFMYYIVIVIKKYFMSVTSVYIYIIEDCFTFQSKKVLLNKKKVCLFRINFKQDLK